MTFILLVLAKIVRTGELLVTARIGARIKLGWFRTTVGRKSTTVHCVLMTLQVRTLVDFFALGFKATMAPVVRWRILWYWWRRTRTSYRC
jgi:hypothetical protein